MVIIYFHSGNHPSGWHDRDDSRAIVLGPAGIGSTRHQTKMAATATLERTGVGVAAVEPTGSPLAFGFRGVGHTSCERAFGGGGKFLRVLRRSRL